MDDSKAGAGKIQDEPGASNFWQKMQSDQRMVKVTETGQKDTGTSLKRPLFPTTEQFDIDL